MADGIESDAVSRTNDPVDDIIFVTTVAFVSAVVATAVVVAVALSPAYSLLRCIMSLSGFEDLCYSSIISRR